MVRVVGGPDPRYISTSYIERQNLTMRTSNMMYYNFGRKRLTLGTTPALKSSHGKLKLNHYLAVQQPYCSVTSAGRLQMG